MDGKDINSSIKSKGKITRTAEVQALNNIQIDEEIKTEIKWHSIIKRALQAYELRDEQEKINYIKFKYFILGFNLDTYMFIFKIICANILLIIIKRWKH